MIHSILGDCLVADGQEPLLDFESASQAVLAYLHQQLGFSLWMVTRTKGDDWIVLQANDQGYGVQAGDVLSWKGSFCARMVQGQGPTIAPVAQDVPAYATAPIGQQVPIGAYIGLPLVHRDGSLFGTLCAIDPAPQPQTIEAALPTLELLANLLSTILNADLRATEQTRRAERLQVEAYEDALTGLHNRRGWDYLTAAEEARCRRYGYAACVLVVDLDGLKRINDTFGHAAGDALIVRAAQTIRHSVRSCDVAARVGGDEFAVLCVEMDLSGCTQFKQRLQERLAAAGVESSIGLAARHPSHGIGAAWTEADQAMYQMKRART